MNEPWLLYFFIFAAVFLTIQFGYAFYSRDVANRRRINQRLDSIESGRYKPYDVSIRRAGRFDERLPGPLRATERLFIQAGGRNTYTPIAFGAAASFAIVAGLVFLLSKSHTTGLLVALPVACIFSIGILLFLRARRIRRFSEQLPEIIEIIVRSLRAGHPLTVSLAMVARQMPDPAGSEIGLTADEIAYGRDISSALVNLHNRVGYEDLRFLGTAITIQHQTGGNLAEILSRLARLMRERFRMRRKVRSLSAEGRLSAAALSVFPFALFGIISLLSPPFYGEVWGHPVFDISLYLSAVLLSIGNFMMYKMVNFKI